jgi:hypothetical protein
MYGRVRYGRYRYGGDSSGFYSNSAYAQLTLGDIATHRLINSYLSSGGFDISGLALLGFISSYAGSGGWKMVEKFCFPRLQRFILGSTSLLVPLTRDVSSLREDEDVRCG